MANRTKEYDKVYQAAWREKNRHKTRISAKKYYDRVKLDPAFKKKHSERYKAWATANPDGDRLRGVKYRKEQPDRFAVYNIRKLYNVTLLEAKKLFERKKFGCEVCGSDKRLAVDHCHVTGRIRGILCHWCNHALGNSKDNPTTLRALAIYLERDQLKRATKNWVDEVVAGCE